MQVIRILMGMFAVLFITLQLSPGQSNMPTSSPPPPPPMKGTMGSDPHSPYTPRSETAEEMREKVAQKAMQKRQEQLKLDVEKLLKLSSELKESVEKTNQNTVSVDALKAGGSDADSLKQNALKQAEEIEGLVRSIRKEMRDSY